MEVLQGAFNMKIPLPLPLLFGFTVVTGFTGMNYILTGKYVLAIIKFTINVLCLLYADSLAALVPSGNKSILVWFFYLAPWFTFDILQSIPMLSPDFGVNGFQIPFMSDSLAESLGVSTSFPAGKQEGYLTLISLLYMVVSIAIFLIFILSKLPDVIAGPFRGPANWVLGSIAVVTPMLAMVGLGPGGIMGAVSGMMGLPALPSIPSMPSMPSIPSMPSVPSLPTFGGGSNSSSVPSLNDVVHSLKPSVSAQMGGAKETDDGLAAGLFIGLLTIVAVSGGGLAFLRSKE
jgi:hypothetical protein